MDERTGKRKHYAIKSQINNADKGALFRNRQKEPGSNASDYAGPLNVGGVNFRIAAWLKDSAGGQKYMSLAIKPDTEQPTAKPAPTSTPPDDDDIPF